MTATTATTKRYWFEWGDEPPGHCHVWHADKNGDVRHDGIMPIEQAKQICVGMNCPYN